MERLNFLHLFGRNTSFGFQSQDAILPPSMSPCHLWQLMPGHLNPGRKYPENVHWMHHCHSVKNIQILWHRIEYFFICFSVCYLSTYFWVKLLSWIKRHCKAEKITNLFVHSRLMMNWGGWFVHVSLFLKLWAFIRKLLRFGRCFPRTQVEKKISGLQARQRKWGKRRRHS